MPWNYVHNLKSEVRKAIDSLIQHKCWEGLVLKRTRTENESRPEVPREGRGPPWR